jgi:hypothetical protein
MKKAHVLILLGLALVVGHWCSGQSLYITAVEQQKDVIHIHYELLDPNPINRYTIKVYSSRDQFTEELHYVTGAIGPNVDCGPDNVIHFNMVKEYGVSFAAAGEETVSFDLRGELYIPFLSMQSIPGKVKRGKDYSISWIVQGDIRDLSVELMKGSETQRNFTANSAQSLVLNLPAKIKPGRYRLRVTDQASTSRQFMSGEFKIVRKVPLAFVIAPVVVGGVIWFIARPEPTPPRLPDPAIPD